ncbi:CBS domain-containing protein [Rhodoligotrophos defluvii]|uniref:CBS domain-containing protein n=1 Tax=Rhodoligotrophos defluvii TaxID=2561934 RepID=UPI001961A2CF|nr:CBS domain-containing protein [Rhodoligotrophos defluvii]
MNIASVMTRDVRVVSPGAPLSEAARMMDQLNVGVLPVCDGNRLVGMITDRDIAVRATAAGQPPSETRVSDAMTDEVVWCYDDDDVDDVLDKMADVQIRRVPVIDHDQRLVGIVSLGDLATKSESEDVEQTLEEISSPSEPDR